MNDATSKIRAFRPARKPVIEAEGEIQPIRPTGRRVLIVDLNNFSTFPTLAIELLVASLRQDGHDVRVLCPLAFDVPAAERERREYWLDHISRRFNLATAPWFVLPREAAVSIRSWWIERPHSVVLREVGLALRHETDVVLLSAYLQHFETVKEIASQAGQRNIPVLLGGPMFNVGATAQQWCKLPGVSAVVGAEQDQDISSLVHTVCAGGDLRQFDGVTLPTGEASRPAAPLRRLDETPMADFTDFPWDRYRVRIVPIMTGRGQMLVLQRCDFRKWKNLSHPVKCSPRN
jgi:anaerobic magnesium-protoporphyrin IX monomethyl ester cyclase